MAEIIVGTGTTDQIYIPLRTSRDYSYSQVIFTQTQIGASAPITISGIQWYYNDTSAFTSSIEVFLNHTTKDEFDSVTDYVTSGLNSVYTGSFSASASPGWYGVTLDTDFDYDNSNNLLISVDTAITTTYGTYDWLSTTYTNYQGLSTYSDTDIDPESPSGTQGYRQYAPNTKIIYTFTPTVARKQSSFFFIN